MIRICFVCLGNICRSPTAEGVMLQLIEQAGLAQHFVIDSAGTGGHHAGERPDPRTLATAKRRGAHLPSIARQFERSDFERFDHILAMDEDNYEHLLGLARADVERKKVGLLRSYCSASVEANDLAVPDPYYGGQQGFEDVFDICRRACEGLLSQLRREHAL
jgi:protein-tyrosine phosphatase